MICLFIYSRRVVLLCSDVGFPVSISGKSSTDDQIHLINQVRYKENRTSDTNSVLSRIYGELTPAYLSITILRPSTFIYFYVRSEILFFLL